MSSTDFVFDKFLRTCDVCGTPRKASELTIRDNVAICVRHPGYRTAKELDKLNARQRVPIAPLRTTARPLSAVDTWEVAEGALFDLITSVAPFETFDTTGDGNPGITGVSSPTAAGWAALYLAMVIAEGKRPAAWLALARTKLASLADYLLTRQSASASLLFGMISPASGTTYLTGDQAIACLAFCKAYQLIGGDKYLAGAKASAHAMVTMQAGNLYLTPSTYGGAPYFFGSLANGLSFSLSFDYGLYPRSLLGAWAMTALKAIAGDITVGETTVLSGLWSSPPARALSVSIAQQLAFWQTGIANDGTMTVINGLSAATPREFFNAAGAGGDGNWSTSGVVTTVNWATGIRALYEVTGSTSSSLVAYLEALGQSASSKVPAGASAKVIAQGLKGTFDPALAPPTSFDNSLATENSSLYDFASLGLLAPLWDLDAAKDVLGVRRRRTAEGTPRDGRTQWLGRLARSGYSFQPFSLGTQRQESVTRAAQLGLAYRIGMVGMGSH